MANAYISTFTELVFLNTTAQRGTVILPSTNIPGRILTFKDRAGTLSNNSITFSTAAANQFFETGTTFQTFRDSFGSYSFATGIDNKWYTVGGSYMNTASISSFLAITSVLGTVSSATTSVSTLQFRDGVTQSTNTSFLLSTNLYYSSPINFFVVGPAKAPKPLVLSVRTPFRLNQITGLTVWLDASDPNTVVFSGNTVTTWLDKSGNRRNASAPVAPTFLNNGIVFNGTTQYFTVANSTSLYVNTYFTIFVVERNAGGNFGYFQGDDVVNGGGAADFSLHIGYRSVTNLTFAFYADDLEIFGISGTGNTRLWAFNLPSYANRNVRLNGSSAGTHTNNTFLKAMTTYTIGRVFGGNYYNGTVYEIISYVADLSVAQIQQVEGYLAWKWGLVGNLPSTHPFKNSPP